MKTANEWKEKCLGDLRLYTFVFTQEAGQLLLKS